MKKSKRINRNLSFIGIIILGVLVYVFGTSVYDGLNTVSPWRKINLLSERQFLV